MLNFIPPYTIDFEQLWEMLSSRNRWFINLRFVIIGALAAFVLVMQYIFKIGFTQEQVWAFVIITTSLLFLNIFYSYIAASGFVKNEVNRFNQLHFAFNQIVLDVLAIALMAYYTGGIESPFYFFYVFHMIIGSLILPGAVVYILSGIIIVQLIVFSFLEYYGELTHYTFGNLLQMPLYDNPKYIIIFITAFGLMMFVSVYLANNIARGHFRRSQELKLALDKLSQAEKMKMKYTMGVVHEIKTPIVAVQSNLDLMLQGYAGELGKPVKDRLKRARARTDEAINIINDVLNISKLRMLEKVKKEEVNIIALISGLFKKRSAQAKAAGVEFKIVDMRQTSSPVKLDAGLIELALSNLIGNAIKYNTPGGLVEVTIRETPENDFQITVADNGIGIPDEDKGKMFKEFYRSANAKQKGVEGTGLGLSVVSEIIEHHGGIITYVSPSRLTSPGRKGTEFIITLFGDEPAAQTPPLIAPLNGQ